MPRHRIRSLDPFRRLFSPGAVLLGAAAVAGVIWTLLNWDEIDANWDEIDDNWDGV